MARIPKTCRFCCGLKPHEDMTDFGPTLYQMKNRADGAVFRAAA